MTNFGTTLHMADFKIEGLDKVLAKMQGLGPKLVKKGLRTAGTKAMRIVRDDARRVAKTFDDPESGSNIAKNIVTRYDARGSKRVGGAVTKVGVAGGARPQKGREDTGHWRLIEFGTEHMRARPFMRPALENNVEQVTTIYVQALDVEIDKALK
jgi:HK97 gp10 family phage protein